MKLCSISVLFALKYAGSVALLVRCAHIHASDKFDVMWVLSTVTTLIPNVQQLVGGNSLH